MHFICANTDAVFTQGECQCKDGYMIKNAYNTLQKYLTEDKRESCVPSYQIKAITVTTTTATILVDFESTDALVTTESGNRNIIISGIAISKKTRNGYVELSDLDTFVSVNINDSYKTIVLQQLDPGTQYLVTLAHYKDSTKFKFVTQCSCKSNGFDVTGRPTDLLIKQEKGFVMFDFIDNSHCDGAYSFFREYSLEEFTKDSGSSASFAPDFFVSSSNTCDSKHVTPGKESSDDLRLSKPQVGAKYAYCVRATNSLHYMDSPYDATEGSLSLLSSDSTCASHIIHWEASVSGLITTEPNAGSLPIENATISYQLLSDEFEDLICEGCSGNLNTTYGGSFQIEFLVDHPYLKNKNNEEIPVRVYFSKQTIGMATIDHIFLCNEGQDVCDTENGLIFYLKHLNFNKPLHIYDDTSIPFSGKIAIQNTVYSGGTGCPIMGADVCLMHKTTQKGLMEALICVKTNSNGIYQAPVIIGSVVHDVEITYETHTFVQSHENQNDYSIGLPISSDGFYNGHDFMDTTTSKMYVEGKSFVT